MTFFKPQIIARGTSTTLPILKKSSFEEIAIPVPPLDQQEAYSKRVASVDTVRMVYREQEDGLESLFASLQHRAFRGAL